MIFELKEGKFYPSSGNSAMLGVFERGRETEIKAFCDTSILHSSKVKNCTSYLSRENDSLFVVNRAREKDGAMTVNKIQIVKVSGKVVCIVDDETEVLEVIHELEDVCSEAVVPAIIMGLIKDDYIYLEAQEAALAVLESRFLRERGMHASEEVIGFRRRLTVLKRFYDQLLNGVTEVLKNAEGQEKSSYLELNEVVSSLCEEVLNLRDFVSQVREAYQEQVDIGLNTVMKFLTVVTSIFMPLSFIAGWYGMNLKMPEVELEYGYLIPIVLTVVIVVTCVVYFVKKKWFS